MLFPREMNWMVVSPLISFGRKPVSPVLNRFRFCRPNKAEGC